MFARKYMTLVLTIFILLFVAGEIPLAHGQISARNAIQHELEMLKQRIEALKEILHSFPNKNASDLLLQAESLGRKALTAFNNQNFTRAKQHIALANRLINEAMKLAMDNSVQRLKNRLEELMHRAENQVIGSGNREAERLVQEAKKSQFAAHSAQGQGQFARAVELYRQAILLLEKALKMAALTTTGPAVDLTHQEKARFEALAERALEAVRASKNQAAMNTYELALRQAKNAEHAWRAGNRELALKLYNAAFRLMLRALDQASTHSAGNEEYLRNELATVQELMRNAQDQLVDVKAPRARFLLRRAEENVHKARRALNRKNVANARLFLNMARGFLRQLFRLAQQDRPDRDERLAEELASLQSDIVQMRGRAGNAEQPGELLNFAESAARRAEKNYRRGLHQLAIQQILIAQRFLSRAERELAPQTSTVSVDMATKRMNRLQQMLGEIQDLTPGRPGAQGAELVREAQRLLRQARQNLRAGKARLAFEMADIGIELLRKAIRLSNEL